MIKDKLHIFPDTLLLSEGFTSFIEDNILVGDRSVNISLSGGSTPKAIFDYWAQNSNLKFDWTKIRLFWGDERCVPPDNDMSNYKMTKEHLLNKIDISLKNIFRIHGENEVSEEVLFYSQMMREQVPLVDSTPQFDLMMLGLGDDGHTVSIFPHQIELWDSDKSCVVATHPESGMKRISLTGKIVNNAKNVVFLATGKAKAEKVRDIIRERDNYINLYPAAKVAPKNGVVHWFLDDDAASLL